MNAPDDQLKEVQQWIEKAEDDLRTAAYLLTMDEDCPFSIVCFHAQQSAEKYLKALLVTENIDFPKTHDLAALLNLLTSKVQLSLEIEELLPLNRYSVDARYPGDPEPYARDEAEDAIAIARKVAETARSKLPIKTAKEK